MGKICLARLPDHSFLRKGVAQNVARYSSLVTRITGRVVRIKALNYLQCVTVVDVIGSGYFERYLHLSYIFFPTLCYSLNNLSLLPCTVSRFLQYKIKVQRLQCYGLEIYREVLLVVKCDSSQCQIFGHKGLNLLATNSKLCYCLVYSHIVISHAEFFSVGVWTYCSRYIKTVECR